MVLKRVSPTRTVTSSVEKASGKKERKKERTRNRSEIYLSPTEEGTRYYIGVAFLSTIKRAVSFDDQLAFCEFLLIIKFISIFVRFN